MIDNANLQAMQAYIEKICAECDVQRVWVGLEVEVRVPLKTKGHMLATHKKQMTVLDFGSWER